MKQAFQGHNQAIDFAQIEAAKQRKRMYVFLTRDDGVKYVVADTIGKQTVVGKLLNQYGEDVVMPAPKPFIPPTPVITKIESTEEPVPITITTADLKTIQTPKEEEPAEIIEETETPIAEEPTIPAPSKKKKKKENE